MTGEVFILIRDCNILKKLCLILVFLGIGSCQVWGQTQNAEASSRSSLSSQSPDSENSPKYEIILQRYQNAAQQGNVSAQYAMGLIYYHGRGVAQNYNIAHQWFEQAARKDHTEAQYYTGFMHYYGKGTSQDYANAVEWFFNAAEKGHAASQYYLGFMYYFGRGVAQNFAEAFKWFEKSALQSHPPAQYYVGLMYERGINVEKNEKKAIFWYRKAIENGDLNAKRRFTKLNKQEQIPNSSAILKHQISAADLQKETSSLPGKQISRMTTPNFICDTQKWVQL